MLVRNSQRPRPSRKERLTRAPSPYFLALIVLSTIFGCSGDGNTRSTLREFPIDGPEGIEAGTGVMFDREVSADGNGSLRVTTNSPGTFPLLEVGTLAIDRAELIYQAAMRSESVEGRAFLRIACVLSDGTEGLATGTDAAMSGTHEWQTVETVIALGGGAVPRSCLLGVEIDGTGTVWVDDVSLLRGPLP